MVSAELDGQFGVPSCNDGAPRGRTMGHLAASVKEAQQAAVVDGRQVVATVHLGDIAGAGALSRFLIKRDDGPGLHAAFAAASGFSHAVVGNDWFSLPPAKAGELAAALAASGVPVLSANVTCAGRVDCGAWANMPSRALVDVGGLKVAVIGFTSETIVSVVDASFLVGLQFSRFAASLAVEAKVARDAGADLVVAAVHLNSTRGGFAELDAALRESGAADLVLVNQLGEFRDAHTAVNAPRGTAVAVSGRTPTEAIRVDLDVVRTDGKAHVTSVRTRRYAAAEANEEVAGAVLAVHQDYCEALAKPLPVVLPESFGVNDLLSLLADTMREAASAEVAVVNEGLVTSRAFPLTGPLTTADLHSAIRYDDTVVRGNLDGATLRSMYTIQQNRRTAGHTGMFIAGLSLEGDELRINGRPIDDAAPYRVVMPDFVARNGDDLVPVVVESEPVSDGEGHPVTTRALLTTRLAAQKPGTKIESLPRPDLADRFRWSWTSAISLTGTDTRVVEKSAYQDRRLQRDAATVYGAEFTGRMDGEARSHAVRLTGRARYYAAIVQDTLFEIEDFGFVEALYRYRGVSNALGNAWWAPIPYASFQVETEFVPPDPAVETVQPFQLLDPGFAAGLRLVPLRPFEPKLGVAVRRQVFDPAGQWRVGVVAGFDLPRFTAFRVSNGTIDVESSLDWFAVMSPEMRHEARARLRVLVPVIGPLSLQGGFDALLVQVGGGPVSLVAESLLALTIRLDGATQWF